MLCNKHLFNLFIRLTIYVSAVIMFVSPTLISAAETTSITALAPDESISGGEQFIISVVVEPNQAIAGVQFDLSFDPSLVTVNGVEEGNLLKQDGANTFFNPGTIDNATGTVSGVTGVITSPGQTVSTPGTLAIITLTAGTTGDTCPLTLSNVVIGNITGQSVPVSVINSQITIHVNQSLVLNPIGDKSVNEGDLLEFTILAADPDNSNLLYSAVNLPKWVSFDPETHTFSWTPRHNQSGTYSDIRFTVSDGSFSDSESITINVRDVKRESSLNPKGKPRGPKK